jgi:hypothetical protein
MSRQRTVAPRVRGEQDSERRAHMAEQEASAGSTWLRILSGVIIALIIVALLYAGAIGLMNMQRIGV